ncbi:uncharacterized protein RCO7_14260 [Rhynchosporium graminicola]|uniref:Uncharacterized protein n=1 Tax=Rhynchosporium graminicola TaxID=2792576 RepID=A0A1E1K4Y6_9HELO|nr:uncharacterized protein RCO7_14260 [Rhynchosporium commune]
MYVNILSTKTPYSICYLVLFLTFWILPSSIDYSSIGIFFILSSTIKDSSLVLLFLCYLCLENESIVSYTIKREQFFRDVNTPRPTRLLHTFHYSRPSFLSSQ